MSRTWHHRRRPDRLLRADPERDHRRAARVVHPRDLDPNVVERPGAFLALDDRRT